MEMRPLLSSALGLPKRPKQDLLDRCAKATISCSYHIFLARNSPVGHPIPCCHFEPCFIVTVLYISIVYIFKLCNTVFIVRVLAMPHPLCTCTLRVLYACGREFVPSVYFLPIMWNGISPPQVSDFIATYIIAISNFRPPHVS